MKKMILGLSTLVLSSGLVASEVPSVPGEIIVKFKYRLYKVLIIIYVVLKMNQ